MQLTESLLAELAEWFFNHEAPAPAGFTGDRAETAVQCFEQLFLWAPMVYLNAHGRNSFDKLIADQFQPGLPGIIDYHLPHAKYVFLSYLLEKGYLLHGTKSPDIDVLEPREQTDWNGNSIRAVFATRDVFWPMYFALLDRSVLTGSLRNGCFLVERATFEEERFYFFSVSRENLTRNIWSDGFMYILRGDSFHPTTSGKVRFDEWASEQPVPVVAKLPVTPSDFPFIHQVSRHDDSESIFTTWLRYRDRLQGG